MRRVNVIIKGFDKRFGALILERTFRDIPVGYCASLLDAKEDMPALHATEHVWYSGAQLRMEDMKTEYDVDWNTIRPLDEELIYAMRETEAIVLDMFVRFERLRHITYEERKRAYLQHLRYWNHIIEEKKIDLFLSYVPHQCYDNVIYGLCKLKNIPTFLFYGDVLPDSLTFMEDWEQPAVELRDRFQELQKEHEGRTEDQIPLSPDCDAYFRKHAAREKDASPWYMPIIEAHPFRRSAKTWLALLFGALARKPLALMQLLLSGTFWSTKREQIATFRFYEGNARVPDLTRPYIYVALHMQPECSTAPLAGAFVDQLLIVQLLSSCLPKNVQIYVKEHPHQKYRCRSVNFYRDLLSTERVCLVPRHFDTFQLIEHAAAVATATGTVGLEARLRGIPVLLFGHRFYQYAPDIYPIHSTADCAGAVDAVFNRKQPPNRRDIKLFMKAYDETRVRGYVGRLFAPVTKMTETENAESVGGFLSRKILALGL